MNERPSLQQRKVAASKACDLLASCADWDDNWHEARRTCWNAHEWLAKLREHIQIYDRSGAGGIMSFYDQETGADSWLAPSPATAQIEVATVERTLAALADAKENAEELLVKHLEALGETIGRNKHLADFYRQQIDELNLLIKELKKC